MNMKCARCLVVQLCPTLCNPMDCSPPGSCLHGIFQARILEWVTMPSSKGSSQPRNQSPILQAELQTDSLPSEPPGKPKNTGMGSLSLLQGIFLIQELNWHPSTCIAVDPGLSPGSGRSPGEWMGYHYSILGFP